MTMTFKKSIPIAAAVLCLAAVACSSLRNTTGRKYIKIHEQARKENFTNEQLRNYVLKNSSPAIVVRSHGSTGSISSLSNSDRICSLLEMGLAKNHFDVRDRALFENVIASNNGVVTYSDLYEATHVDLLMEITSYSTDDYYNVDGYYDESNQYHRFEEKVGKTTTYPQYLFRGMSISIKVTLLKDNLVGGSYSYSYVPCSEESGGALITQMSPLRYRPALESRDINAVLNDPYTAGRLESAGSRLDRAMENFITDVVVPGMMRDIKGGYGNDSDDGHVELENVSVEAVAPSDVSSDDSSDDGRMEREIEKIEKQYTVEVLEMLVSSGNKKYQQEPYVKALERMKEKRSKAIAEREEYLSSIEAKNSFGQISEAVSALTESKFFEQSRKEVEDAKKKDEVQAKIQAIRSLYEKLYYLNSGNLAEIAKFVSGACSMTGLNIPADNEGKVVFFMPTSQNNKEDSVIILFVDGNCVGAGTLYKGFYSSIDPAVYDGGFHEIEIIGVSLKNNEKTALYKSTAQFDIKRQYVFSAEFRRTRALASLTLD